MVERIGISNVLAEVNRANSVFSVAYRKTNGEYGEKHRVTARRGNNPLNERKRMNRSGLLKLTNLDNNKDFDIVIDLLIEFNGIPINFYG